MVIKGVKFRHGTVTWEDAVGRSNDNLPDFDSMQAGDRWVGYTNETTGRVAKIGNYVLIITKFDSHENLYDYTLIPFTRVKITYHLPKKRTKLSR